ncbi:MAG: hypothetical protein F4092_06980 [Rhodospirillaceae bacterium]|nr:hypothetical protein [Rhodospirillaceae bacterium]
MHERTASICEEIDQLHDRTARIGEEIGQLRERTVRIGEDIGQLRERSARIEGLLEANILRGKRGAAPEPPHPEAA